MADRRIATVTQINNYIKALLDGVPVLGNVWIKGEISNLKFHSSGHIYLTLKDDGAVLRAVMFRGAAQTLSFRPENGDEVLARGRVSVYERDGQYQLYIEEMEKSGTGGLTEKFEALKKKLAEEGLFDRSRKLPIPKFPKTIGIVTSPTGAAVRDMINVLSRRYPMAEVLLFPALVQGEGAAHSIVSGINYFNENNACDVLIVGRGGGSIEDLWAFNEETVARAVAGSRIPVISAVGHETDFTICDFAAALRAPTPSAAAEIAVPDAAELKNNVAASKVRMANALVRKCTGAKRQLELLSNRGSIANFSRRINDLYQRLDSLSEAMERSAAKTVSNRRETLSHLAARLNAASPLSVLSRGYGAVTKENRTVSSINDVTTGDRIEVRLSDGRLNCLVDDKIEA